ncbi:hypothetical protein C8R44DRAFT_754192 [Mycena epipterygia]|nr:hypothetical protein C8R44DRAFT_754192 [Mycena epipterygia]
MISIANVVIIGNMLFDPNRDRSISTERYSVHPDAPKIDTRAIRPIFHPMEDQKFHQVAERGIPNIQCVETRGAFLNVRPVAIGLEQPPRGSVPQIDNDNWQQQDQRLIPAFFHADIVLHIPAMKGKLAMWYREESMVLHRDIGVIKSTEE